MDDFDLIVVGSGSGNAIPDYLAGWRIAIVERSTFGGTCLNVGCIPTKMLVVPADLAESVRNGKALGVSASIDSVDFAGIQQRIFGRIDPISVSGEQYRATGTPNVELIKGTGTFSSPKVIDVAGRKITAPKILIAAGSRPSVPNIPGLQQVEYHTSDTIMRLKRLPKRLGILGGGFIATEMAHIFGAYGSEITIFNRSGQLLRRHDHEVSKKFTQLTSQRFNVVLNASISEVAANGSTMTVVCDGENHEVDELLVATGRRPNSDTLHADAVGLKLAPDGRIRTNKSMQTSVDGIWACGDITNSYQLKHLANAEAKVAFWNIAHPDNQRQADYRAVPSAVFSRPQLATVGMTEQQATDASIDYVVGRRAFSEVAYGWALEDQNSFAKVLIERGTNRILGAHILGPQAATLIQPLIQAIQFGQNAEEIAKNVFYIHPALTEVVENALLDALAKQA